jgi:hypothetical protein
LILQVAFSYDTLVESKEDNTHDSTGDKDKDGIEISGSDDDKDSKQTTDSLAGILKNLSSLLLSLSSLLQFRGQCFYQSLFKPSIPYQ